MKKKRFQKPPPPAAPLTKPSAEQSDARLASTSAESRAMDAKAAKDEAVPGLSFRSSPPLRESSPLAPAADDGLEPTAIRRPFPVLLFALLGLLLYWADMFLLDQSGHFQAKVFYPYTSTNQLDSFLPKDPAQLARAKGQKIYGTLCTQCHQPNGGGSPALQFPPLAGSDWVLAEGPNRIIRVVLNGAMGPFTVSGAQVNNTMVPWRDTLNDDDIAAVLTYVRNEWGNKAAPVTPAQVKKVREGTKARATPWTMDELKGVPEKD